MAQFEFYWVNVVIIMINEFIVFGSGLIAIIGSIVYIRKIKEGVPDGQVSQETLVGNKKYLVFILSILNPIWSGLILYYGLRKNCQ